MIKKKIGDEEYTFDTVDELIEFERAMQMKGKGMFSGNKKEEKVIVNVAKPIKRMKSKDGIPKIAERVKQVMDMKGNGKKFGDNYYKLFKQHYNGSVYKYLVEKYGKDALKEYGGKRKKHKMIKPVLETDRRKIRGKLLSAKAKEILDEKKVSWSEALKQAAKEIDGKQTTVVVEKKAETQSRNASELKFISNRTKHLANTLQIDYEKARELAISEVNNKSKAFTITPAKNIVENFPVIRILDSNSQSLIEDMLKNMIGMGGTLTYYEVINTLKVEPTTNGGEWDGKVWHYFIAELLQKSSEISDYFCVVNRFKHEIRGKYEVLSYKKKVN
jgi:hypothetical protein